MSPIDLRSDTVTRPSPEMRLAMANAEVNDADVIAYFAAHADDFQRPALRRPSHIQLSDRAEAEAVRKSLVGASVEQFASVARQRSLDERTRKQGGQLGYCDEQGQPWEGTGAQGCPVALAKAVFALAKSGELAPEPVEHDGAFSVVMLTGLMPAKVATGRPADGEARCFSIRRGGPRPDDGASSR